jgi:hypothetical protein
MTIQTTLKFGGGHFEEVNYYTNTILEFEHDTLISRHKHKGSPESRIAASASTLLPLLYSKCMFSTALPLLSTIQYLALITRLLRVLVLYSVTRVSIAYRTAMLRILEYCTCT